MGSRIWARSSGQAVPCTGQRRCGTLRTQMAGRHLRLQPTIDIGLHLKDKDSQPIPNQWTSTYVTLKIECLTPFMMRNRSNAHPDHCAGNCYSPISTHSLTSALATLLG